MTTTLLASLDELQEGLDGLLACLEAQPLPEENALRAAWLGVQRVFERVQIGIEGALGRVGECDATVRERIERCARLHAVVAGVLALRCGELAGERALCSSALQRVRARRPADASGASCDVRA